MPGFRLEDRWSGRGPIAWLLLPLSLLYELLVLLRRGLYRCGWWPVHSVDRSVIVVGNVIAGGAGKTPTTMALVRHLQGRGLCVGVVSRGYGRTARELHAVTPQSTPEQAGDEPLLIAQATGAPVFVHANRHAAAQALLAAHPHTQVILCDDGLQHYALRRDLEVCVFDDRGIGNGWLLPSGPLREPWPRRALAQAGQSEASLLVLHTGERPAFGGFHARRSLATHARNRHGEPIALAGLQGPLLALAGIAQPHAFFDALRAQGLVLDRVLALPDHADFSRLDCTVLQGHRVLCTEKDAAKLWRIWPEALAVPLQLAMEPAFLQALDERLNGVLAAKLSSGHGHQTA